MKILWIVNTMFPDVCIAKGLAPTVIGGWMYETANSITRNNNVELTVVTCDSKIDDLEFYSINSIDYFIIPNKSLFNYNDEIKKYWDIIFSKNSPDIIHIHGSEFPHGLVALKNFPNYKYVLSVQGLVGVYARYYLAGIHINEILKSFTLRDLLKGSILKEQNMFKERGKYEREYYENLKNVIGRTTWDYVHCSTVNPKLEYHFCNESLRRGFYECTKWNVNTKCDFQIFLSQAGYPIKGIHQLLKAASLLKNEFPNLKIRVGGADIMRSSNSLQEKLKISGYGVYVKKLIKKFKLEKNIEFLGFLDEEKMILEYQNAHVFVCPSAIENSPNSVGEAQMIGTPVVASYVGGVSDLITHGQDGFIYRFEEFEMLAYYLRQIFIDEKLCKEISENGIITASLRHDLDTNNQRLLEIYNTIA